MQQCTKQSPWSFTTRYFTTWKSTASVSPYHSCPVAFWSLSGSEQLQGARITSGISDVCLECGVAPNSIEHLFNCQSYPTQVTDLWDNPAAVADFINLDNWRWEISCPCPAITTAMQQGEQIQQYKSCYLMNTVKPSSTSAFNSLLFLLFFFCEPSSALKKLRRYIGPVFLWLCAKYHKSLFTFVKNAL